MRLTSPAFEDHQQIPLRFSRDGENMAPPLNWAQLPGDAVELAVVFQCLTPSTNPPLTQWLCYKIPATLAGLPEGLKHKADPQQPTPEILHGRNDMQNVGYDGPQGTAGQTYDYVFRLYALDQPLDVESGLTLNALEPAMGGHILDKAELHARFERPRAS